MWSPALFDPALPGRSSAARGSPCRPSRGRRTPIGWCPKPFWNVGVAPSFSLWAASRVVHVDGQRRFGVGAMVGGLVSSQHPGPGPRGRADVSMAANAAVASVARRSIVRDTVGSEAISPSRAGSARGSAMSARHSLAHCEPEGEVEHTFAGSCAASRGRHGSSAVDLIAVTRVIDDLSRAGPTRSAWSRGVRGGCGVKVPPRRSARRRRLSRPLRCAAGPIPTPSSRTSSVSRSATAARWTSAVRARASGCSCERRLNRASGDARVRGQIRSPGRGARGGDVRAGARHGQHRPQVDRAWLRPRVTLGGQPPPVDDQRLVRRGDGPRVEVGAVAREEVPGQVPVPGNCSVWARTAGTTSGHVRHRRWVHFTK